MTNEITIINQDSGYLMIDIANSYVNAGYRVNLIAGRLVLRNKSLHPEIRLNKIIKYRRNNTINRLFSWGIGTIQILILVWLRYRKSKLLIVSNPPMATLLPLFFKNNYSLLIYDVYPDALYEMGVISAKSPIIRSWERANKKVFKKAKGIITITEGMKNALSKYTRANSIEVIPIWTDNNYLKPLKKEENSFIKDNGLEGKFIVLYSGNLGLAHDVEVIINLAMIIDNPVVKFVIIGDGEKKDKLARMIHENNLKNCLLLPFQSPDVLPFSLAAADVAIVTLAKNASLLAVPSKTYNLMSVGAPIMCMADKNSELANLVRKYEIGECYQSHQHKEMKHFIEKLIDNKQIIEQYRNNSINASKNYGLQNVNRFIN